MGDILAVKFGESGESVDHLIHYLSQFGHWDFPFIAPPHNLFDEQTRAALENYQRFFGLPITGELDNATLTLVNTPRCGVPDTQTFDVNKWPTNLLRLSASYTSVFPNIPDSVWIRLVLSTFDTWAAAGPVNIKWVLFNQSPHMYISYGRGEHGDPYPFDGPGHTLAHAFFPPPAGGNFAGQIHVDLAESWVADFAPNGYDLEATILHELGHALGLEHTSNVTSVMYPYYPFGQSLDRRKGSLTNRTDIEDKAAINQRYGHGF